MRFYPDEIPPFWMEPLKKDFSIVNVSLEVGVGVVAKRAFKKG